MYGTHQPPKHPKSRVIIDSRAPAPCLSSSASTLRYIPQRGEPPTSASVCASMRSPRFVVRKLACSACLVQENAPKGSELIQTCLVIPGRTGTAPHTIAQAKGKGGGNRDVEHGLLQTFQEALLARLSGFRIFQTAERVNHMQ